MMCSSRRLIVTAPEDRISQLPDEILHQILSCSSMSTRDPILLATLSKRWRCLWKSSPYVNLEDSDYLFIDGNEEAYSRFVDTVLLLRDNYVYSFRLFLFLDAHPHGQQHLYRWVQYAVRRNAKVIELNFHSYQKNVDLPPCIFACQSVEELRFLFGNLYVARLPTVTLPKTVQLGRLKKLHLKNMDVDGPAMRKIMLGCPVADELVLESCWLSTMIVWSPTLRVLVVEKCGIGGLGLLISCPRLVSFRFAWNIINRPLFLFWGMLSLVSTAVLCDEKCKLQLVATFGDCIGRLANAKTIEMINPRLEFISEKELSGLPPFINLKNLTLGGWKMSDKFLVIAHLIQHSPNLQMLTLTNEEQRDENDAEPNEDSHEEEAEPRQNHSHETEAEHSQEHRDEGQQSQEHAHDDKCESRKELKQLWFHCAHTVITCRVQCGEENERLVDLVSKAIVSKYTLPDHNVRIIDSDETYNLGSC